MSGGLSDTRNAKSSDIKILMFHGVRISVNFNCELKTLEASVKSDLVTTQLLEYNVSTKQRTT